MNIQKLQQAERAFLERYPGGVDHPEILAIAKKHNMDKLVSLTQESLAKQAFQDSDAVIEAAIRIITRSTLVSLFEKPKFRDGLRQMPEELKPVLVEGYQELLHGEEAKGFNMILDVLSQLSLAKWPLMTAIQVYFRPDQDVLVKPTTAKGILRFLEIETLVYKPRPSWEFYVGYRKLIHDLKAQVHPSLRPYNAGFTGFLMMSMELLDAG